MTIHYLKPHQACSCCETEMSQAPFLQLTNGQRVIPQHYLQFEQNLQSLREILSDIEGLPLMPLFADEDGKGLYLQVGMIGRENYERGHAVRPQKLVYGRKWRIDSDTPTSEIIQTVYLAIKKAREHEVRELLTIKESATHKTSTPFSTHQDLPLMANNRDLLLATENVSTEFTQQTIENLLTQLQFAQRPIRMSDVTHRANSIIVDITLGAAPLARQREGDMHEYDNFSTSLVLSSFNPAHFLHALMDVFIHHSDAFVAEHFAYKGFARFSRNIHPEKIAALSIATRPYARDMKDQLFAQQFRQLNYQTDASRVPAIGAGVLAEKNRQIINSVSGLLGHMPKGFWDNAVKTQHQA